MCRCLLSSMLCNALLSYRFISSVYQEVSQVMCVCVCVFSLIILVHHIRDHLYSVSRMLSLGFNAPNKTQINSFYLFWQ